MKQKNFIASLIMLACAFASAGIYGEDNDSRVNIAVEQPLSLDTYELPAFSFSTADEAHHKASITVTLAYAGTMELQRELEQKKDVISNDISLLLAGKSYESLDSFEDVILLSEEIKAGINSRLSNGRISEVYFWNFVLD